MGSRVSTVLPSPTPPHARSGTPDWLIADSERVEARLALVKVVEVTLALLLMRVLLFPAMGGAASGRPWLPMVSCVVGGCRAGGGTAAGSLRNPTLAMACGGEGRRQL